MRTFDVKCDAEEQDDGSFTLLISVTGLELSQASQIAEQMKDPFRAICMDVLTEGGALPASRRDLLKDKMQ